MNRTLSSRRHFTQALAVATAAGCLPSSLKATLSPLTTEKSWFAIGGFGDQILLSSIDSAGQMSQPVPMVDLKMPAFMAVHPRLPILYAVRETSRSQKDHPPQIVAFRWDAKNQKLEPMGSQAIDGDSPCYVEVDLEGRYAMVANYSSGSAALYPLTEEGAIQPASDLVVHRGGSRAVPSRQEAPHAHCIQNDPSGRWVCVADLGLDQVLVYRLDRQASKLVAAPTPAFPLPPGSGPRHLAFHPNGRFAYIINEINSTLTAARWDADQGRFDSIGTVSTRPDDFPAEKNSTAEVLVHPNGRFVYGSNRGHDSIATFQIDPQTGAVTPAGHTLTGGKTPRNFRIDPSGQFLLAQNQSSHDVHSFRIDPSSGSLSPTGSVITAKSPACIKFLP